MYPTDRRYSTEHEWARRENSRLRVGITKFAADRLSDVVFIQLPTPGTSVKFMEPFGVIESVKAVSDLYAPVSGQVVEVNTHLVNAPEVVNQDPHEMGWIVVVQPSDPSEFDKLMMAADYEKMIGATSR